MKLLAASGKPRGIRPGEENTNSKGGMMPLHIVVLAIIVGDSALSFLRLAFPVMIKKWWKYLPLSIITVISIPFSPIPGIPLMFLEMLRRDIEKRKSAP
ncbi:MAG: hypothetical protein HGB37_03060 [Candidatus Moranbacteria bacterium]|nr:hypothetical protein [Candidatus Moranbacteria bacterium]